MNSKFYVLQITNTGESDPTAIGCFEKDTLEEAKMLYHQTWASIYANSAVTHAMVAIYSGNDAYPIVSEVYDKPLPPPVYGPVNEIDL